MSLLLSCQAISKAYGAAPLFAQLSFGLFEGDRVGLVGPNGSGKSTLLRILAGTEAPDSGMRSVRRLLRLGYVPQDPSFSPDQRIEDIVSAALGDDPLDSGERHTRVNVTLAKTGFADVQQPAAILSGGWTKRLAIACALVRAPDLLLMDEPTNHLDVEGILWLEKLLRSEALAFLVVSHDRYFLENVANRIIELNRCYATGVLDTRGNYSAFLEKKDEVLRGQEKYQETLANRVRREVEWLQHGPKARTRKSGARIQGAAQLQDELATVTRRTATRTVRIEFSASDRRTKRLLVAEQIAKRFDTRPLIAGLSLTLTPGMRLGILGPNGSGKTTLLRMLAGDVAADSGTIERADGLRIVYLDQHREQIDDTVTLRRALAPEGDQVVYGDRPLHVATWAKRFLFPAEQLDMSVARLSGGERARVAIAALMLRPADVLILDEPTNDLDIPTLEVLEESLLEFPGAVVLVTHDRFLFDRVSTIVLALDGRGGAEVFADYQQWEDSQRAPAPLAEKAVTDADVQPKRTQTGLKRLSYTERREWEQMEAMILAAEQALTACHAAAHDPSVAANAEVVQQRYEALREAQEHVDGLYARWAELEDKQTQP
jgi:ABC transport system ATP-binding/permease protein